MDKDEMTELIGLIEHYLETSRFYGGGRIRLENKINEIKAKINDGFYE